MLISINIPRRTALSRIDMPRSRLPTIVRCLAGARSRSHYCCACRRSISPRASCAGCIITRKGSQATPVLLTTDKQTLIDRIAHEYQAVQSFNATVDMVPALGSSEKSKITEYKDVRGYILFRKPADIRIIGLYPVVRNKAFDMVSDGKNFRLYLPSSNRFITGSNELIAPSKDKIQNLLAAAFSGGAAGVTRAGGR